jgi:arylsulfatase A-like enzyme
MLIRRVFSAVIACAIGAWILSAVSAGGVRQQHPRLIFVYVVDGFRPDAINSRVTPNIDRLRREGVEFSNAHSTLPTVTRVNAASIASGTYPNLNGITSNTLYDPAVNGGKPFPNSRSEFLQQLAVVRGGRVIPVKTLSEILTARGLKFVAVSSGSTGQALLLNSEVQRGNGVLINGGLDGGSRVAYPDDVSREILSRFGPDPGREDPRALEWTERLLREYALPTLQPDVVIDWLTEPDGEQHSHGVGSPEAEAAIQQSDRAIGQMLETLKMLDRFDSTDVIIIADHGFAQETEGIAVVEELSKAGLKEGENSDDVVITSDGQSLQFFVKNHSQVSIRKIVEFIQQHPWSDAVFVGHTPPADRKAVTSRSATTRNFGWLPGTFSLDLIHLDAAHAPDIVLSLPWKSDVNSFGAAGTHAIAAKKTGAITTSEAGHGGFGPWTVHTPMIAWGPDFKRNAVVRSPSGNIDIAPTILNLEGIPIPSEMQGRPLLEALRSGPDSEKMRVETHTLEVSNGRGYKAAIHISNVNGHDYVDKTWRVN